ncbi:MAG TPA: hypothetical protein VFG91_10405 [Woeseiaceae bacterium]|nr:hypothetical protein [Woeseiaceae bacterium]
MKTTVTAVATAASLLSLFPCAIRAAGPGGSEDLPEERLSWGAELELELIDTEGDAATDEPAARFHIDQLYLYPKLELTEDAWLSADIAVKVDTTYIEEAWFRWQPGETFWVQAGLDDAVIGKLDRKSEAEILVETAFYRSDALGVQLGGALVPGLEWWTSATNGFELTTHQPSEDDAYPIIHDGRRLGTAGGGLLLGGGVRFTRAFGDGEASAMPFAYRGGLDRADVAFLQTLPGYGTSSNDRKNRWGATLTWQQGPLTVLTQEIEAEDGELERSGLFVQPAWRLNDTHELVYRYNRLRVDLPAIPADARSWDRTQHVFALISTLADGVRLKTEYYINDEETGGAPVDNDELMIQLEVAWKP